MQLIQDLMAEHELIEQVLGSLRTFAAARVKGQADPADGHRYLRFFRLFAGHYHHAREEEVLFAALVERAEVPGDRGPVAAMVADHGRMAGILDQLEPLLGRADLDPAEAARMEALAVDYSHALWHHIDAENSVVLPEGEARLRRHFVLELPGRPPSPEEEAARAGGEALLQVHPPLYDPTALRGDGCVHCPSYGTTCQGVEREWWTEWDWDEFEDHMQKD